MLESWDFVDPLLASKIKALETELNSLRKQQTSIISNKKTSEQTKQKLLTYNKKCVQTNIKLLDGMKHQMTEYFDRQIHVLTKTRFEHPYQNANTNRQRNKTKLKQSVIEQQRRLRQLNLTQRLSAHSFKNDDSTVDGYKIFENLNSTSHIASVRYSSQNNEYPNTSNTYTKPKQKTGNIKNVKRRVKKRSLLHFRKQIQMFKNVASILTEQKYALQLRSEEDNQLLALQAKKISILQQKCRQLEQQKVTIERGQKQKIAVALKDHTQLRKIQQQNKYLAMQRNSLVRQLKK